MQRKTFDSYQARLHAVFATKSRKPIGFFGNRKTLSDWRSFRSHLAPQRPTLSHYTDLTHFQGTPAYKERYLSRHYSVELSRSWASLRSSGSSGLSPGHNELEKILSLHTLRRASRAVAGSGEGLSETYKKELLHFCSAVAEHLA